MAFFCFHIMQQEDLWGWGQDTEEIPGVIHQIVDLDFSRLLMLDAVTSRLCNVFFSGAPKWVTTIHSLPSVPSLPSLLSTYRLVCTAVSLACLDSSSSVDVSIELKK